MNLGYRAMGPVSSTVRAQVRERARRSSPRHGWWAEGFGFVDPDVTDGPLSGSTKLMLVGAVPPEIDMALALRDATFIVRRLAWWSLRYRITWALTVEGAQFGRIRHGVPSRRLMGRLATLAAVARFLARTPVLFLVRRRALREYADRWGDADAAAAGTPEDS